MVEVQALTSPSILPSPRRVAIGVDYNRLMVVSAVLTRRVGMSLANQDIVVNATGGFRISEPAVDVGVALAIISSLNNIALPSDLAVIGEVGLSAEIRSVPQLQLRIEEVFRLGFKKFMIPSGKNTEIPDSPILMPVSTLQQASKLVI
jgi:DNA repair protein RadA/Sms